MAAAEQRDELTPFPLTEMHPIPSRAGSTTQDIGSGTRAIGEPQGSLIPPTLCYTGGHCSAPPLPSRLASRSCIRRSRSGTTSSTLHQSQQRPAATGWAVLPKPVYGSPQIEQYGPPQIEHV